MQSLQSKIFRQGGKMLKTREQIEQLKKTWKRDPCFDIEETKGFEEHKTELYLYRREQEAI
jgi:hypothetical protein